MRNIITLVVVTGMLLSCDKKNTELEEKATKNDVKAANNFDEVTQNKRPAYLIASSFMPEGHGSLDAYYHAAHPLLEAAGGETIITGHSKQEREHFEGEWNDQAAFMVFKFPSMEALLGFLESEEYQKVRHLRTNVIPTNFTFAVEGFLPIDVERYLDENKDKSAAKKVAIKVENTILDDDQRPAYLVASSFMPEGHGSLDAYYHAAHPLLEAAGGETIIGGHTDQIKYHLEGKWKEQAAFTLFKFPSMKSLLSFWKSEEYQKVKHLRTDVIASNFTFATEGFMPIDVERYLDEMNKEVE